MSAPLTYSNYSTLHSCGRRFKLQCIDLVPQPRAVALEFGSAMHAGLHDVLVTKDVESAQDVFGAFWNNDSIKGISWTGERHGHRELGEMGLKFIANFHKKYGKDMEFLTGEKRLRINHENIPIEGTPDALVLYKEKRILLDFKTSAYNYIDEKLDTSLQLNLYAHMLTLHGQLVDELAYVVFSKGTGSLQTLRAVHFVPEKAKNMVEDMVQYWTLNSAHHIKNPNSCVMGKYTCPFIKSCWERE